MPAVDTKKYKKTAEDLQCKLNPCMQSHGNTARKAARHSLTASALPQWEKRAYFTPEDQLAALHLQLIFCTYMADYPPGSPGQAQPHSPKSTSCRTETSCFLLYHQTGKRSETNRTCKCEIQELTLCACQCCCSHCKVDCKSGTVVMASEEDDKFDVMLMVNSAHHGCAATFDGPEGAQ